MNQLPSRLSLPNSRTSVICANVGAKKHAKTHEKHAKNAQNWQILAINTTTRGSIHGNFAHSRKVLSAHTQKFGQSAHAQPGEIAKNVRIEQDHSFCDAHF
jgi:hypothetical protein